MEEEQDMSGKVCLVTGATAGIGQAAAKLLAQRGARVVGIGRNPAKNENSTRMIREVSGSSAVEYLLADLSSPADIRAVAEQFLAKYDRLDVLVNNAGASFQQRRENDTGIEMTLALNHLGYYLLTNLLIDILQKSAPARVINVSSGLHKLGKFDFEDIPLKKGYNRSKAYRRSKLANVAFTYELARRLSSQKVMVNAMNPGLVATNVADNADRITATMKRLVDRVAGKTPEEGARTIIYLATSPEVEGVSGRYFVDEKSVPSAKVTYDLQFCRELWAVSEELVGLPESE